MGVIIGMDPHKGSATIEVIDQAGRRLAARRFGTDKAGYADLLAAGRGYPERVWAVEGCNGIGKHIAHRLVHDGEVVVDVPPKLSAQVRVFATGNGRKTDPVDARSVALAALYAPADPGLHKVAVDDDLVVMVLLVDRRDELGRARTQTINRLHRLHRLHRLLLELFPGGANQFLSAPQARALIATTKPRDLVDKTRRRLAVELVGELEAIDRKIKTAEKDLAALVTERGSTLMELTGIGPTGAARLLADIGASTASGTRTGSRPGTAPHPGRLLRRSTATQAVPGREPQDQPDAAHHGRRPTAEPHSRPAVLRRPKVRWHRLDDGHACPETSSFQCRVRPHAGRPEPTRPRLGDGPGRAPG